MEAPGDIPVVEGGPSRLVWLVDGAELPFIERSEPHRPWLEESTRWASSAPPVPGGDGPRDEGETLLWL